MTSAMILLTGALGYVGTLIRRHFEKKRHLICVDIRDSTDAGIYRCDLGDPGDVRRLAEKVRPRWIVHATGNKNIGYCEKNPDSAFRINCDTMKNLAMTFGEDCRIVYISTDYVFRGDKGHYAETDIPDPVTVYGKSKLCGETEGARIAGGRFTVLRTAALFDMKAAFPQYLHENLSSGRPVECFSDVIYSPTYFEDFLEVLERVIAGEGDTYNPFHVCGDTVSRYEFALAFAATFGFDPALVRETTGRGKGMFLFPNLTMDDTRTRTLLQARRTGMEDALREMKRRASSEGI